MSTLREAHSAEAVFHPFIARSGALIEDHFAFGSRERDMTITSSVA